MVGYDPDIGQLPPPVLEGLRRDGEGRPAGQALEAAARAVERTGAALFEACAPWAVAVKLQVAYFLALGGPGLEAARRLVEQARSFGLLVIADAKPGDIASTAAAYALALLGFTPLPGGMEVRVLGADACTFNPYLGGDSAVPFLDLADRVGKGIFALVHTSNPGAQDLQQLVLKDGRTVAEAVADMVLSWAAPRRGSSGYSSVGAVVGATYPDAAARLRRRLPGVWLLLPGVGAQGASPEELSPAFDRDGLGAVVSVSRSILGAWRQDSGGGSAPDWTAAAAAAAKRLAGALNRARRRVAAAQAQGS